jgi:hypothetical protein
VLYNPSSCTAFFKGTLARDASEQSICRCHQLNSLAVSGDSEELYLLGSSRRHAPHQEGTRSSFLYQDPAGGNTDTTSARSRRLPCGRPRHLGKPHRLPDRDRALPAHPLASIIRAKHSEDQAWEKLGCTTSSACYPLLLASTFLALDAGGTTGSIRWTHTS